MRRSSLRSTVRLAAAALAMLATLAPPGDTVAAEPLDADASRVETERAVTAYREAMEIGDRDMRLAAFAAAELLFARTLAEGGAENADLWTNLGNAALQAERLGAAVHAFRSALRLDPDHRRAHANLIHARKLLPSWVPRPEEGGALDTFLFWHRRLSPAERSALAAASCALAAALLALGIARRRAWPRTLAALLLVGWVALLATSPRLDGPSEEAVVIVDDTIGRAADSGGAPSKFSEALPAGAEVRILEEREAWRRIGLPDGRDAWVPAAAVARIGER
jgi:tetratricopeptide (TPR) repeat protein